MIKAKGKRRGKDFILLGLSDINLEKLREGKPLVIDSAEMGIVFDIVLLWGPTELDIVDELDGAGMIDITTLQIRKGQE